MLLDRDVTLAAVAATRFFAGRCLARGWSWRSGSWRYWSSADRQRERADGERREGLKLFERLLSDRTGCAAFFETTTEQDFAEQARRIAQRLDIDGSAAMAAVA